MKKGDMTTKTWGEVKATHPQTAARQAAYQEGRVEAFVDLVIAKLEEMGAQDIGASTTLTTGEVEITFFVPPPVCDGCGQPKLEGSGATEHSAWSTTHMCGKYTFTVEVAP